MASKSRPKADEPMLDAEADVEPKPAPAWLTTRVPGGMYIFIGILLIAIFSRLFLLGERPLRHDESIHAVFSWKILQSYQGKLVNDYEYDPTYHGPFLYYLNALIFLIEKEIIDSEGSNIRYMIETLKIH